MFYLTADPTHFIDGFMVKDHSEIDKRKHDDTLSD